VLPHSPIIINHLFSFSVDDLRLRFTGFERKGGRVEEMDGIKYLSVPEGSGTVQLCTVMLGRLQGKTVEYKWTVQAVKSVGKAAS